MQEKTKHQAGQVSRAASAEQLETWRSFAGQCKLLYESGDVANLELALNQLSENNAPLDVQLRWQERLALAKNDYPSAIKTLQANWHSGFLDKPEIAHRKLTKFYRQLKDPETVLDCAQHALMNAASFLPPMEKLVAAVEGAANPDDAQNILLSLYYMHPESKPLLHAIFKFLQLTNLKKLHQFVINNGARIDEADLKKLLPPTLAFLSADSASPRFTLTEQNLSDEEKVKAASMHAVRGDMESARTLLSSVPADNISILGQCFAAMIRNMPADNLLTRPILQEASPEKEVIITETHNAVGTVIVFTGLADQPMLPITVLDRYWSALGLSAVYLRDLNRCIYLKGVSELGNNLIETIASLRDILERLQTKRLFTFATSAGGFAAMRYGLTLNAEAVLCFSPQASFAHPQETRAKIIIRRLMRELQPDELDIRVDFAKHDGSSTRVDLYYGKESPLDRMQAELLASIKNVTLHGIDDYEHHSTISYVACGKGLLPTIVEHFRLEPI